MKKKYLYQQDRWPEMREAMARQPVVALPIGDRWNHHLPLDVNKPVDHHQPQPEAATEDVQEVRQ